ncbi:MAG: hypothetical protein ACRDOB_18815, partial [Streptosporangiaceae bacterium]
ALRALLLTQAKQQQAQAVAEEERIMAEHGKKAAVPTPVKLSDDDYVFDQATTMLWNPLVGPALRAALYKVLATTPGVQVRTGARDGLGRAAVEISRYEIAARVNEETFEDPGTGAVLETAFVYRGDTPEGTDLYLSVTGHRTLPPDLYGG